MITHKIIDINKIIELIPHRYPILLVDRIIELTPHEKAVGIKNVTFNEPHFMGHFPAKPIMPGVLIIEAMAQTSAVLVAESMDGALQDKLVYFMTIDNVHFRKPVIPGDTIRLEVTTVKNRGRVWKFKGEAFVDGQMVADAEFAAMIMDK